MKMGNFLTPDMTTYIKELSLDKSLVELLKHSSIRSPKILLGWQLVVVLEAGAEAGESKNCSVVKHIMLKLSSNKSLFVCSLTIMSAILFIYYMYQFSQLFLVRLFLLPVFFYILSSFLSFLFYTCI